LTSAKSREKGTDETLREIEATGLGRLSSFPSVNFFRSEFHNFTSIVMRISQSCVRVPPYIKLAPEKKQSTTT
jgi:hypothetical protein